jgi:hypothetical protein
MRRRPQCRFDVLTLTSSGNPTMPCQVSGSIRSDGGGSGRSSPPAKSSGSRTLRRARKSVSGRRWTIPTFCQRAQSSGNSSEDRIALDPRGYPRDLPTRFIPDAGSQKMHAHRSDSTNSVASRTRHLHRFPLSKIMPRNPDDRVRRNQYGGIGNHSGRRHDVGVSGHIHVRRTRGPGRRSH